MSKTEMTTEVGWAIGELALVIVLHCSTHTTHFHLLASALLSSGSIGELLKRRARASLADESCGHRIQADVSTRDSSKENVNNAAQKILT